MQQKPLRGGIEPDPDEDDYGSSIDIEGEGRCPFRPRRCLWGCWRGERSAMAIVQEAADRSSLILESEGRRRHTLEQATDMACRVIMLSMGHSEVEAREVIRENRDVSTFLPARSIVHNMGFC